MSEAKEEKKEEKKEETKDLDAWYLELKEEATKRLKIEETAA